MNRRDFLQGLFAAGVVAVAAPATIIEAPLKAPIDVIVDRLVGCDPVWGLDKNGDMEVKEPELAESLAPLTKEDFSNPFPREEIEFARTDKGLEASFSSKDFDVRLIHNDEFVTVRISTKTKKKKI
jgi:hypothetical protein